MKDKLALCQHGLVAWRKKISQQDKSTKKLKAQALSLIQDHGTDHHVEDKKKIQKELEKLLDEEDLRWKQRAK